MIYIDPAEGTCYRSEDLSDPALFQWLSKAQSIGRTAYFNELRKRRVGGALRSCLTGHHNKDVAQSILFPVCGAKLYDDVTTVLGPMLCDVGFSEAVRELSTAFEKFTVPAGAGDFAKNQNKGADIVNVDGNSPYFAPLSAAEDLMANRLCRQLLGNHTHFTLRLGVSADRLEVIGREKRERGLSTRSCACTCPALRRIGVCDPATFGGGKSHPRPSNLRRPPNFEMLDRR